MDTSGSLFRTRPWRWCPTSFDVTPAVNTLSSLVATVLIVLGVWRSAQMARGFVDRVYKSKALWMAALTSSILLSELTGFIQFPSTALGSLLVISPLVLVIIVSYGLVDRTIIVAMRADFFHRDALGWTKVRLPGFVLVAGALCLIVADSALVPSGAFTSALWSTVAFAIFVGVVPLVLGYAAIAIVVSARRTADRTLKRHILFLGVSLACFAAVLALFALPSTDLFDILEDALNVASLYMLYRAVMSLTLLGRVEKVTEASHPHSVSGSR